MVFKKEKHKKIKKKCEHFQLISVLSFGAFILFSLIDFTVACAGLSGSFSI